MERIQVLIDKLQEQKRRNETAAQMLITVQLLQQELSSLQKENKVSGTSKVAVVMPASSVVSVHTIEPKEVETPLPVQEAKQTPPVATPQFQPPVEERREAETRREEYRLPKPAVPEPVQEPVRSSMHANFYDTHFEAQEAPTLIQQQIHREVHDLISEPKESLNDRLKQQKTELAHVLKETPIKDLRKGIGVNDKFTFINELFRGDEAMYERSIKTINSFHILQEAEYWMNRELKVKLGWSDTKDTVQRFFQIGRAHV
jgi:hypothetical protein